MPRKSKKNTENQDLPKERSRKGKRMQTLEKKKQEKQNEATVQLVTDVQKFIEDKASETGKSPLDIATEFASYGLALIEFDETQGKASLVFENWKSSTVMPEKMPVSQKLIEEFRDLRDNFAPVAAGIEWHKDFTCYDDKTEVLTEDGWKLFIDLTNMDRVATLAPNGELEYQLPLRKMNYDYDGNLWAFKNQQIDLMVTPNHKILMRSVGRDRLKKPFKLVEVSEAVKYQKIEMKKNAKWNCSEQELFFLPQTQKTCDKINQCFNMDDWLEFFGYYLSEGCTYKKSGDYVTKISQNKFVHPETYHKIENCIKRLGYNHYANNNYFTICNKQLWSYLKQFGKAWEKFIPYELKLLSPEKLRILYNAMIDGDGIRYSNTNGYFSSSKRLIDDMQEIMLKLGFAGNVKPRKPMEQSNINGRNITSKHQGYRIFEIDFHGLTPIISRKDIREVYYKGKIYSCEVPNHILYVRRNGIPIWSGNSGGGFNIQIDNPKSDHQKDMKEEIISLCRTVYQDSLTYGMDAILDIMMEPTFTDGCAGGEIVYGVETNFNDYIKKNDDGTTDWEVVEVPDPNKKDAKKKIHVPQIIEPEWKELQGITRIKMIEDAVNRFVPYRHPISGEILFWVLDNKAKVTSYGIADSKAINDNAVKFHTWEVFWLSPNRRRTNLKGASLIQAVYMIAKFVQAIQKAVGVGFNRWANKKFFFVCGDPRRPWSKVHINQFLKAMEKMIQNNWVGIPVPPGFDIKDMGGEQAIFEGKNLLDYLTSQICAGMQYPREFLESGKTQASDKAWLAWTVRYGRTQLQIRRAIEHQLFERHLWCKFGKSHKIPVKGQKKSEQPDEPTYVPKIEWRAEGRWHRMEKIKTLKSVLDAANPADAPLKLAIEKDLGMQLGLGSLDFEPYEKLFEMQITTRKAEAEIEQLEKQAMLEVTKELQKAGTLVEHIKLREEAKAQRAKEIQEQPTQEELEERAEKRRKGGVSRTSREQPTKKGKSKEVGGTREPKIAETVPQELSLLPKETADRIAEAVTETERLKQEKAKLDLKKSKLELKRTEKKIKLMNELEERLEKKKTGGE